MCVIIADLRSDAYKVEEGAIRNVGKIKWRQKTVPEETHVNQSLLCVAFAVGVFVTAARVLSVFLQLEESRDKKTYFYTIK